LSSERFGSCKGRKKEKNMRNMLPGIVVSMAIIATMAGCGPRGNLTVEERREAIVDMETETLARLYKESPATKDKIANAAGYGTFANANVNLILASAGGGYGSVVDNSTGKRTYMKMGMGGVGLGLGVKDYRVVMIFKDKATLDKFIESGWDVGAHADAAAKAGETGAELSGEGDIRSGIEVFSMTESGLALQATIAGTKYWKDANLN
jgi:lipid-binding SYLF domain-containing protein